MASFDVHRVFEDIPKVLGMDLIRKGEIWVGPYYMNGERHAYRQDKLRVNKFNNNIWILEQGGESMSIVTWLQRFGGAADWKEAYQILKGHQVAIVERPEVLRPRAKSLFVNPDEYAAAASFNLAYSPLFIWMCRMFPAERVEAVWRAYGVTANSKHLTTFWYRDVSGKICFDKGIYYMDNGHRNKQLPMTRKFRIGDGYTERPYFGAHLLSGGEKACGIVESEKTALLCSLYYGGVWLATGGKSNLRDAEGVVLYPDRDGEEEWSAKGECAQWYADWPNCPDHADIGDYIEWMCCYEEI